MCEVAITACETEPGLPTRTDIDEGIYEPHNWDLLYVALFMT